MTRPADSYARYDYWRPGVGRWPERLLGQVDGLFERVYGSRYNPLHRTGTLASLFLTVTLVTGVYLLLVYQIARPYESTAAIQADVFLGRWIRALHRYASDAALVAVILHALRMVVQGKTWGPRVLAWTTGLVLAAMMFLSAVTGFVLVWDEFGQKLAVVGARMLRLVPLFPEPPDRAFVGEQPMPAQFFFMNLFLHVAVPLGMVFLLWLHTARLARAAWFPERKVVTGTLVGFLLLAVVWPAPLPPAADLLAIPGRVDSNWFYGFWLPFTTASPGAGLAAAATLGAVLLGVPWLLRPARRARPAPAFVDPDRCEGCSQCFNDCPYDAIEMLPGKHPERHPLRAEVQPDLCVSCGLCAGSCASLAIGPEARTAAHQLASARSLVADTPGASGRVLLVACRNNGNVVDRLRRRVHGDGSMQCFEVDCAGTLHPGTVSYLAGHFGAALILACPPHGCVHREGATLADARLLEDRPPAVPGRMASLPVRVLHHAAAEWPSMLAAIDALRAGTPPRPETPAARVRRGALRVAFSAVLLGLVALGSGWPQGADADHAVLRLGWRLAGQVKQRCRDLPPDELARRPVHMRQPQECVSEVLTYGLRAVVDGVVVAERRVTSPGLRADRPLTVEENIRISPGDHQVTITFVPEDATGDGKRLSLTRRLRVERQRVVLITYDGDALVVRGER
jgi:ferredoxin